MRYYPVNLDIQEQPCLVVGGGRVGARKVETLLACGAVVTVVSIEAEPALVKRADTGEISLHLRPYCASDLDGQFLVIGATDDEDLNRRVHADASQRKLLCNIADRPEICNFILPAIVRRGDFMLAISTAGKSPAFAKHLRRQLQAQYGPEYGRMLDLMGAIRKKLLAEAHAPEEHKPLFERLIGADLLTLVKSEQLDEIDRLLAEVLGPGYCCRELMPGLGTFGE